MAEPTLDQKIAWANLQAARLAKEADEAWRQGHPERVAFLVKAPGQGRHMALPESDLIEETNAWLDRSFGPYPARHKAEYTTAERARMTRLWNALKDSND